MQISYNRIKIWLVGPQHIPQNVIPSADHTSKSALKQYFQNAHLKILFLRGPTAKQIPKTTSSKKDMYP